MESAHTHESNSNAAEYLKFAGVIVGISALALAAYSLSGSKTLVEFMRWFMGVFFIVFAAFKLAGYKMFVAMFAGYDIIAKRFKFYAYFYPFIELALGLLYVFDLFSLGRDLITLSIMSVGTVGVGQEIYHRRSGVHCACLGNIIKLPLTTVSLVEDGGMAIMALIMLLQFK